MEFLKVISSNYLLVSINEQRLFDDVKYRRDEAVNIRQKLHIDFIKAVENVIKRSDKPSNLHDFLCKKYHIYCNLIHFYDNLSKKWSNRGFVLEASVAKLLCENEKLNLIQFDTCLLNLGVFSK
jgi:hypothetical protein